MRIRTPVKNVAHNMEMIYNHTLNQFTHCHDKILRPPNLDNRLDNRLIVLPFI